MGTCTEIHEQKLVQEALERSEYSLRDADQRKDRFLATLAHELRNPLAPIATAASLLRLSPDDPDRVRAASEIIERQVQHMTHLVNDLLDVSRVTQGQAVLDVREMDLAQAVREALEQVAPMIERKRHQVRVSLPEAPVRVLGDAARMRQVFANLLVNAAKYTPEGGHIDVRFHVENHLACIEVEDDGVGMDADADPARVQPVRAGRIDAGPQRRRPRHRSVAGAQPRAPARRNDQGHQPRIGPGLAIPRVPAGGPAGRAAARRGLISWAARSTPGSGRSSIDRSGRDPR